MVGDNGRKSERRSSANVAGQFDSAQKLNSTEPGMFLTQSDMAPRTGASATRNGKHMPLLTPGHQRMINLNNSQAFSPGNHDITALDVQREREKIARFLNIKERNGRILADREYRITTRIKDIEKKAKEFEKRQKNERKVQVAQLNEKRDEWQERRQRVIINNEERDEMAWQDYRKTVAQSK